jgi:hypothetical protein
METVPIQTVVGICTGFLSVIGGIIIWSLTKLQSDIKDTKESVSKLETKMVIELDKKANLNIVELRFDNVDASLKRIEATLDRFDTRFNTIESKQDSMAVDIAFIKGREEAGREMAAN